MRKHSLQLLAVTDSHDATRDRDRCIFRIAAGSEGIGSIAFDDIQARHEYIGPKRQLAYDFVQFRSCGRTYLSCTVGAQDDFVGKPVADEVSSHRDR